MPIGISKIEEELFLLNQIHPIEKRIRQAFYQQERYYVSLVMTVVLAP